MRPLWVAKAGLVLIALVGSYAALPHLPAVMPTHWNAHGVADGFGPREVAVLLVPLVMLFLLGLFAVVPRISPNGYRIEQMRGVYDGIVITVLAFMLFVHGLMLAVGLGYAVPIERAVPVGISLLFAALGVLIANVTPNFFVGVRTPWTLTDPENWKATHRFASRLFVAGGLALAVATAAGAGFWVSFVGLLAMGLLPVLYSLGRHLRW